VSPFTRDQATPAHGGELRPKTHPAPTERLWTPAFLRIVGMQMTFGFGFSVFFLLPKILVLHFHATAVENGAVMASFGLTSLLAIPLLRPAMRRLGGHGVLTAACTLLATSCAGFLFVRGAGPLTMALRGLQGIAWSMAFSAGASIVAQHAPKARLAEALGFYGGASLVMNAIGPALAEPLFESRGPAAVFGVGALSALAASYFSRPSRARPSVAATVPPATQPTDTAARPMAEGASLPTWPVHLIFFGSGGAFSVVETFIAPFAMARGQLAVRPFFIAFTAAAVIVRLLFARSIDRYGHRRVTILATVGYGCAVLGTGLFGPLPLALFGFAFGAAHGLLFPAGMALLLRGRDEASRAERLAVANSAMNLGIASAFIQGALAQHFGYPTIFVLAGALTASTGGLLATMGRSSKQPR